MVNMRPLRLHSRTFTAVRAALPAANAAAFDTELEAIVIVTAVRHQAPVVTSGPGDLTRIADAIGVKIRLFPT